MMALMLSGTAACDGQGGAEQKAPRPAPVEVPAAFRAPLGVMTALASGMLFERLPTCEGFEAVGEGFRGDGWTAFAGEVRRRLNGRNASTGVVAYDEAGPSVAIATDILGGDLRIVTRWDMRAADGGAALDCIERVEIRESRT